MHPSLNWMAASNMNLDAAIQAGFSGSEIGPVPREIMALVTTTRSLSTSVLETCHNHLGHAGIA
jgi:hypothetical protein